MLFKYIWGKKTQGVVGRLYINKGRIFSPWIEYSQSVCPLTTKRFIDNEFQGHLLVFFLFCLSPVRICY
jgi:hypothetical protein